MRVGSLFAGIGGFDIAAERVGMTVEWQSENNRHASKVLDHHWPDTPNLGDIHGIRNATAVDVLTGGFPCQDYSVAGTGVGLAGDRGALWWEYLRIITELRPTWVIGENVPGLLSSRDGADFETIVGSLTECGYGVAWAVLDAQYFGVAQRRRRVFIVGHSGGEPRPETLALTEGLFGHPEPSRTKGSRITTGLTQGLGSGGADFAHADAGWLVPTWVIEPEAGQGADLKARPVDVSPALTATDAKLHDRGVRVFAANQRDEVRDLGDLAGGLSAEPGMKQQTFVASGHVRRLTPLECERLQGFPDGWTNVPDNSDTQRYRQLGNAVAVPVAEWVLGNLT